jgi:hypothetical protein
MQKFARLLFDRLDHPRVRVTVLPTAIPAIKSRNKLPSTSSTTMPAARFTTSG